MTLPCIDWERGDIIIIIIGDGQGGMTRSNCYRWSRQMQRERGGYFVTRASNYGWWRHFLWMPADQSGLWSYTPNDPIPPDEWRKRPWWRRLFIWHIWRGRPSDLVPFRFDGHVVQETPNGTHHQD